MGNIVIVGNGRAGIQLTDSLRAEGYTGRITVLGEDAWVKYQRPPLSKDYLAAGTDPLPLPLRAPKFLVENDVDHRLGVRVTSVDGGARTVALDDRSQLAYSVLVLATGARNRPLAVPGSGLDGVHGLRTLEDATAVHARPGKVRSAVVVGAGLIGGAFAPTIATALVEATGTTTSVPIYLLALTLLSIVAVLVIRDRKGIDLGINNEPEQEVGATVFDKRRGVSTDDVMAEAAV